MDVLTEINRLLEIDDATTAGTSMRLPVALRDAAALAVKHLGIATSVTELVTSTLRETLEVLVIRTALDAHYEGHPEVRPDPAEVAIAMAEQDGHALADQPDRIWSAAAAMRAVGHELDPRDILVWAEAQAAMA